MPTVIAETTKVTAAASHLWGNVDTGHCVCEAHAGRYLQAGIKASPRKRNHSTPLGQWTKITVKNTPVEDLKDWRCDRCDVRLIDVVEPGKTIAAKKETASKSTAKKSAAKKETPSKVESVEQFHAVKFSDGYYLATYSAKEITFTSSFREARRFKTYDGAEKIINKMRNEYDPEDLTPVISVVRVTIDPNNPKKTRTQRMGVLAF